MVFIRSNRTYIEETSMNTKLTWQFSYPHQVLAFSLFEL